MKKEKPLRILFAEDLPADAELAEKEIRKSGIEFTARRVDTKENFLKALEEFQPDLIVSDYKMPSFDGMQALKLSQEHDSTIPFIVLTGSMNEETAVECMKAGAANYVIKEHIARLPFAIKEALEQKKMRAAKDKAEGALRESEEKYRILAESSPEMIYLVGKDGRVLYVNSTAASQFHAKPLELVGKHLTEIFPPGLAHQNLEGIQRVIDTKEASFRETAQKFPSGDKWIEARLSPVIDKSGEVSAILGLSSDITERKQAEELLKSSEERLRILFEYAPDAYYLSDLKGTFVDGNKAAEELTGYRKEELIGSNFLNLHLLQPNQLVKASSLLAQNFLGRPTGPDEFILKRKDGSEVTAEIRTFPVKVKDKTLVLGIARDITERKRAEEQIRYQAALLENVNDAIVASDSQYRLTAWNAAAESLYGWKAEEVLGRNGLEIVRTEWPSAKAEEMRRTITETARWRGEATQARKDGTRIPIELSSMVLRDDNGQITGYVSVNRNITERKRAEKQITLLAHTVKSIIECVSITDLNDKILFVNEAFLTTYGYGEGEILGKDITIVRSPNNPPEVLRGIQEATLGGGWHGELMNRTKDGREFPVSLSTSSVRDETGQAVGLVGVATDITKRRQVEEALRHEKTLLDALMDNIPDSIYFKDRQCRLVRINRKMMQDLKLDEMSQAIGKTDVELFGEEFGRKKLEGDEHLMAMGKPIVGLTESRQLENGQINWTSTTKVPLLDDSGEIVGLVGITREINELMKAHEEREHERNLLRTLIDNLPDNIFIKDTESRFVVGNRAVVRQLGLATEEELIGKTDFDLFPRELAARFYAVEQAIIQSGKGIYDDEAPAVDANKEEKDRWVSTTKVPLRDAQGKIMGIVGIGRYTTERKRAEQALNASEEKYRSLFMNNPTPMWVYDVNSLAFLAVNDFAVDHYGYSREAFLNMTIKDIRPPEDVPYLDNVLKRDTGSIRKVIGVRHRRKDGSLIDVEIVAHEIDFDGRPAMLVIAIDITERKRAEEALAAEHNLLRTLIDNLPDRIYIKDVESRFLLNNVTHIHALGAQGQEEVTGKTDYDFRPRDLADRYMADDRNVIKTGQPLINREEPTILESGEGGWLLSSKVPVRDLEGKIIGLVGISRDITKPKKAEEALKKSEEQYRQFFEDDLTGDYVSTPEGKVLSCNPAFARIYGFASIEEALKADTRSLYVEPEDREIFLRLLKERRKLEYYESEYLRRDGARVYCVENAVGIFDQQDNLVQFWGYIFDDTKRKTLERQLIQAQKLESLGTLASGIAHDFNNILGIILGYATLLTRQKPDPENIKSSADAVIRASQRGASLVKQLLTFARKVDVQLQSVRLNDIVNEISKLLSETMTKTVEITLHLEEDLPSITGDPSQIHQVLINLCVNARDAMPKGGTIGITTSCQQGETIRTKFPRAVAHKYVVLRVADTGIGMDKRTRSRIFEPFYTTKEIGKGTGLGLSVVFGILESHNGFVDVESEPGKGTSFYLYFPVIQTVDTEQAKAEVQQVIPGGKETILIVEDEEMLTRLLRTSLQAAGYTVLVAVDGQEAVDLFDQHQDEIQLVLSDVGLPKLTGYDVFRKMKSTKPDLKFILASGFIEPQLKSEIFKEGVRDFVQKPYSVYEVLRAIRTILDQR